MNIKLVTTSSALAVLLTACGGGDVNITPTNVTNNDGQVINEGDTITNEGDVINNNGGSDNGSDDTPAIPDDTVTVTSSTSTLEASIPGADTAPAGTTFTLAGQPANGFVVVNADGSYFYRPVLGFTGTDSFEVTVVEGAGDGATKAGDETTVTVEVSVTASSAACASYVDENNATQTGSKDASGNCVYDVDFASSGNPVLADVTFGDIGNAAHIFQGSLFIGQNFTTDADMTAAGITEGGDGNTVTIAAGATLAFQTSSDFMVVNRGSQIMAQGTKAAPITITSVSDVNGTLPSPEAVSQWGGLVINGFGVTNKCSYSGSVGTAEFALDGECHVASEGSEGLDENHYGGANNADNSGVLEYFIVKHTGATVGNGDELNGITFGAVGSGTTINWAQAYSTFDDGFEFFGGAVDVTNFVALYVNDDSIDMDEGYRGTITNALVIQSETDGNRCVEADGIGSYGDQDQATIDDFIARGLNSRPTVNNLTCIISPTDVFDAVESPAGTGTHDPGQGLRLREALFPTINNALITSAYLADAKQGDNDHNYCVRVTDAEGEASVVANDGDVALNNMLVACQDLSDSSGDASADAQIAYVELRGGQTYQTDEAGENPSSDGSNDDFVILDGFYSVANPTIPGGVTATLPDGASFFGAVSRDNDWTAGWAYGLEEGNRGQALYFESQVTSQPQDIAISLETDGSSITATLGVSGDDLAISTSPSNGYVFIDGSEYVYRPALGFTGNDSFAFTANGVTQSVSVAVEAKSDAVCASYVDENNVTQSGTLLANGNCSYDVDFASSGNPVLADVTFANIGNAAHIFDGSLFIGQNYKTDADLTAAGITQGGDANTVTIEAGATLAFQTSSDFMVVNRGSQIMAEGSKADPITITSLSDVVGNLPSPEAVSQWGGLVINGFGVTNKCSYTGVVGAADFALDGPCHVSSEGSEGDDENHYGGANNADNSGVLEYFIVKHTGATVGNGDELNGITFSGVGSGTTVNWAQAYSTYDDGFEFFGGAVNVSNYIALYVNDDSIDMDEGYRGTVTNALVIQSETNGNRCVEADGIGSYGDQDQATIDDFIARELNSRPTINNLTCIISPTELFDANDSPEGTGTHDPGQGLRLREALFPTINNALITSAYLADAKTGDDDHNYCVRVTDAEGEASVVANDGNVALNSMIVACQDLSDSSGDATAAIQIAYVEARGGQTYQTAEAGEDPTANSNANLEILDGFYSVASPIVNGSATTATLPDGATVFGAVSADADWTEGWSYGLHEGNRGQALYFEAN